MALVQASKAEKLGAAATAGKVMGWIATRNQSNIAGMKTLRSFHSLPPEGVSAPSGRPSVR